jgi:hypothetical protein
MSAENDALSATEAAEFFGLSLKLMQRQAHNGVIRRRKRGGAGLGSLSSTAVSSLGSGGVVYLRF